MAYAGYSGYDEDSVKRQRAVADALMQRSMQGRGQPIQHWTQGLAQLAEALMARQADDRATKAQNEFTSARKQIADTLLGNAFPDAQGIAAQQLEAPKPFDLTPQGAGQRRMEGGLGTQVRGIADLTGDPVAAMQFGMGEKQRQAELNKPQYLNTAGGVVKAGPDGVSMELPIAPKPALPPGMRMGVNGQPEWIPGYMEGYRKMHPESGGNAPSGYRWTADRNLEPITGGPADPEAEGDVSLSEDAKTNAAIRYNITGTLPPMGAGKAGTKLRQEILDQAAAIAKLAGQSGEDLAAAGGQYMANRRALSDLQTRRTTVATFEKMFEKNLDLAMELGKKVDNNGIPIWNKFVNAAGRETGDPDIAAFKAALYAAGNEYAKIVSGATGASGITDASRQEVEHIINTGMSNGQLSAVADVMRREVTNRTHGMDEEYNRLSGLMRGEKPQSPPPPPPPPAGGLNAIRELLAPHMPTATQQQGGQAATWTDADEARYQELLAKQGGQ